MAPRGRPRPQGRPRGRSTRQQVRAVHGALDIVFRVAASPRIGFGHLVRALHLARAAGVSPRVSIRGNDAARETAQHLGATLLPGTVAGLIRPGLSLLVIDDPSRTAALPWLRAARRAGVRVVSIHDVAIAPLPSDLAVDGSLGARRVHGLGLDAAACRLGPAYAVLSPDLAGHRTSARRAPLPHATVVVGLGGGRHAVAGATIARHLRSGLDGHPRLSQVRVLLSLGLRSGGSAGRIELPSGVTVIPAGRFRAALAQATVAIVAGGTTLYEACALGTPVVAVPVVPGQATPVRRFVRAGLAVGTGRLRDAGVGSARWGRAAAAAALDLLADAGRRDVMARRGRAAVDGRGGQRVAAAIARLLDRG
jgi:spore coat polysaccharide biosynthesis predicted glycosyltransferase SpsG